MRSNGTATAMTHPRHAVGALAIVKALVGEGVQASLLPLLILVALTLLPGVAYLDGVGIAHLPQILRLVVANLLAQPARMRQIVSQWPSCKAANSFPHGKIGA